MTIIIDGEQQRGTIGYGRFAAMVTIVLALCGVAYMLIELTRLLMLVFAAVVFAVVFDAIANRLCRWTGMPRGLAIVAAVLLLLGIFFGVFTMFGAQLIAEFDEIRDKFPAAVRAIEQQLNNWGLGEPARNLIEQGTSDLSTLASRAGGYVISAGSSLSDVVLVLVGAIFFAADPDVYRRGVLLMTPRAAEPTVRAALSDVTGGLRGWMRGQGVSMIVAAAMTSLGLWLLGVPAFAGLGLIAGLLDVIPFVGPVIAAIPAVLLAFTVSPMTAVWTIVMFIVIQQIQGNFLQPMIQKQAVDVPPAILLFAVLASGTLFGFLGVLLAAPVTIVAYVLVQRIYVKTLLGKDIKVAGREEAAAEAQD